MGKKNIKKFVKFVGEKEREDSVGRRKFVKFVRFVGEKKKGGLSGQKIIR